MQNGPFGFKAIGFTAVFAAVLAGLTGTINISGTEDRQEERRTGSNEQLSTAGDSASVDRDASKEGAFTGGSELLAAFWGFPDITIQSILRDESIDLDILIATVPDPIDSHLEWMYDTHTASIRRAYEVSNFVMDRFWLPWQPDTGTENHRMWRSPLGTREIYPGVILFRHKRYPSIKALRLLYLVGETPTRGIHQRAFEAALYERADLIQDTTIKVLGPTFSGSSVSLRHALRSKNAVVISGSATDGRNKDVLEQKPDSSIQFSATVYPDEALTQFLKMVLGWRGIDDDQVALLRESTTQYGEGDLNAGAEQDSYLTIPFPVNISTLRAEYERHPEEETEGSTLTPSTAPRIPLSLQSPRRPTDTPPTFSTLTPPSLDLQLEEITRTLISHDIRAVGLLATDVRDKLFLAREIKKRMRDVQLFTYESNVLYVWPEYNNALRGMLVFSSYPLILQNQWWTAKQNDQRKRLSFSSDGAEGVYNATLFHLNNAGHLADYSIPTEATDNESDPAPLPDPYPPVWLSTVGKHSLVPLRVWGDYEDTGSYLRKAPLQPGVPRSLSIGKLHRTPLGFAFLVGTILFGLYISLSAVPTGRRARKESGPFNRHVTIRARRRMSGQVERRNAEAVARGLSLSSIHAWLELKVWWEEAAQKIQDIGLQDAKAQKLAGQVRWGSLLIHQELYLALRIVAMCGILLPAFVLLFLLLNRGGGVLPALLLLLCILACIGCIGFGLFEHSRRGWQLSKLYLVAGLAYADGNAPWWKVNGKRQKRENLLWKAEIVSRILVVAIGCAYGAATLLFVFQILLIPEPERTFFVYRAIQLDSGVSPLLPLFVYGLTLTAWCSWHLQRIGLLRETTPFEAACLSVKPGTHPFGSEEGFVAPCARHVDEVWKRLLMLIPTKNGAIFMGTLVLLGVVLAVRFDSTMESLFRPMAGQTPLPNVFEFLFPFCILSALGATLWAVYRCHLVWRGLQAVLENLSGTPLLPAFERLPQQISHVTRLTLLKPSSADTLKPVIHMQWRHLHSLYRMMKTYEPEGEPTSSGDGAPAKKQSRTNALAELSKSDPELAHDIETFMHRPEPPESRGCRKKNVMIGKAITDLNGILQKLWRIEPTQVEVERMVLYAAGPEALAPSSLSNTSSRFRRSFADPVRLWLRTAEEFAAMQVVDYIEWTFQQLRRLALFLFLSLLLTTVLISYYPFQPQSLFKLVFLFTLIGAVGVLLMVLVQASRDEILSRIEKNNPGSVTWDKPFVINLILLITVPLLTLASSEFPVLRSILFAWLSPVLKMLGIG